MAIYRNQAGEISAALENQFLLDVMQGLHASPKHLQSKYFYDAEGDKLFQQIMKSPEYYLTNCELEIFSQQTNDIAQTFLDRFSEFDIVELGSGDATKSGFLLKYLKRLGIDFTYFPVDISKNVITLLERELPLRIPGLKIKGLNGEYLEMIKKANTLSQKKKIVLLLGSNIGNFSTQDAARFLLSCRKCLMPGDLMMIGFDLKKNPKQILSAYNDSAGITRQFNLNLLKRINRELGADFDLNQFEHYPVYDPVSGACRSFLISLRDQSVAFSNTEIIKFSKHEPVYTELSQKYSAIEIAALARAAGYKMIGHFYDSHEWFIDVVWEN